MDTPVSLLRRLAMLWRGEPAAPATARVLPAYAALARYHIGHADLEPRLRLLATQLAAERSGCQWCIDRGRHLWREAHLPLDLLDALPEFETSTLFSPRERAALDFVDAVTRYTDADAERALLAPLASVRRHLSEPEVAALTAAVAEMHFFNPATGRLGATDERPRAPWGAPAGSSIRSFWL